jgi:hypothetical protein
MDDVKLVHPPQRNQQMFHIAADLWDSHGLEVTLQ